MGNEPDSTFSIIPAPDPPPGPAVSPAEQVIEAEWVWRYPARRRRQWQRWVELVIKLSLGAGLAWLFYLLPSETLPSLIQSWKTPIIIFFLVCFIGKTLLDTFFYDRYQP